MSPDIKGIYDKLEEIPENVTIENFRSFFTERDGKFELTKIPGVQTDANVRRLEIGLEKERGEHKKTKTSLAALSEAWGDLTPDEVRKKLDRFPELEAAAAGKLDDAKIEELAQRRVEAAIHGKTAPLERNVSKLTKERDEALAKVAEYDKREVRRTIHDRTRAALVAAKALPEAHEDALLLAERVFEVTEEGNVVTKDGVGVTPGLDPAAWLAEIQEKRPHWWPPNKGGGAKGSGTTPGGGVNPWHPDHWNATKQGEIVRSKGADYAARLAESVGSKVGAPRPPRPRANARG